MKNLQLYISIIKNKQQQKKQRSNHNKNSMDFYSMVSHPCKARTMHF